MTEQVRATEHWAADVVASDGGTVHLRPLRPGDEAAVIAFHNALSQRSRYLRYFSQVGELPDVMVRSLTHADGDRRVVLAVTLGSEIIALGQFDRAPGDDEAEVAFLVSDAHQGRGIGSVLLEHLAAAAREVGIGRFSAVVLGENRAMLRVFRDAGYVSRPHVQGPEVELDFAIDETAATAAVAREREQFAESRSIHRLLYPSSVAVVGASNDQGKIGSAVFLNLLRAGFAGPLYPINPDARSIHGVRAYPTLAEVPDEIDLAVVAVPAESVPAVVAQAAARHVHGLVVISGGFGETGDPQGLRAQRDLLAAARTQGMRVVGPNCLGVANADPQVGLNATLAPTIPLRGRAGFFCQSGALGVAVLAEAARRGLGISTFVSAGNRVDVSGNDLLQYWQSAPDTDIALLYLESFGNPRKFARLARRLGRTKPVVVVKSGRGAPVAALRSTTVRVPEDALQALFERSGIIRVDTIGEMFDVALLLTAQPLPAGDRVAVIGNSSALGGLVTDALSAEGLSTAQVRDLGVRATAPQYRAAIEDALRDEGVDAVVTLFVPPIQGASDQDVAAAIRAAQDVAAKPVVSTFLGLDGVPTAVAAPGDSAPAPGSVPSYPEPQRAVRALARAVRYAQWRATPLDAPVAWTGVDLAPARELVSAVLAQHPEGRALTREEAAVLLGCVGIVGVPWQEAREQAQAQDAFAEVDRGAGVALRGGGSVRLHLSDTEAVGLAWSSLDLPARIDDADAPAVVQAMTTRGIDVVLELREDPAFGSLISFGLGGSVPALLGDRAYGIVPLTASDAHDLIRGPRASPVLTEAGADLGALEQLALRLSLLGESIPEVAQCVLSPVVAASSGAAVLDVAVQIRPAAARADVGPRRLRGM